MPRGRRRQTRRKKWSRATVPARGSFDPRPWHAFRRSAHRLGHTPAMRRQDLRQEPRGSQQFQSSMARRMNEHPPQFLGDSLGADERDFMRGQAGWLAASRESMSKLSVDANRTARNMRSLSSANRWLRIADRADQDSAAGLPGRRQSRSRAARADRRYSPLMVKSRRWASSSAVLNVTASGCRPSE